MPIIKTDERTRILIPKNVRKELEIKPKEPLLLNTSGKDTIILKKIKGSGKVRQDPFLWDIEHPAKIKSKRIQKLIRKYGFSKVLEKLEEEM